jgi:hypothetical protein
MATTVRSVAETDDQAAVERARYVGRLLDEAVEVPGTGYRIGLDPILGVMPLSGDFVAALGSLYIVALGITVGVPRRQTAVMLALVTVEFLVGSVPVLGTLLDAVWKVNTRNARVIESYADA